MNRIRMLSALAAVALATMARADTNAIAAPKLTDEQLGEQLQRAIMLVQFGFYAEAEETCKRILEQNPDLPTVKELLQQIQRKRKLLSPEDPAAALKQRLETLTVPAVNFRDAPVRDAIEWLREESGKLSPDKQPLNVVWMVPADAKLPGITLKLQQVPLLELLRYVTELAGLRYRLDPHAVVIFKPEPAAPTPNVAPE
jgi:hypothetical protein